MKKRAICLSLVALLLLSGLLVAAGAAVKPAKNLATPQLKSPRNGATINFGDPTSFEWRAVSGATCYQMDLEVADGTHPVTWKHTGTLVIYNSKADLSFQAGYRRWRVTALDTYSPSLMSSLPSNWRTFTVV